MSAEAQPSQKTSDLIAIANAYRDALMRIRVSEGKVCDEYETCTHRACQSSYAAWAIADEALRP